jgi:CheY-like chemotaxis protein
MPAHFQDALDIYLLPLLIAVPVIIVLYLLATGRKKAKPAPPRAQAVPAAGAAPAAERPAQPPARVPDHPPVASPVATAVQAPPAAATAAATQHAPVTLAPAPAPAAPPQPAPPSPSGPLLGPRPVAGPAHTAAPAPARPAPTPAPAKPEWNDTHLPVWNDTQLPDWADTHPPVLEAQDTVFTELPLLLLVDDSAVVRAKLRKLFEGAGFATEIARDGLEALERLQGNTYALMITDMEMPNMDGVALIAAVARNPLWRTMPVLAITGHDDLQAKARECHGVSGIFKKPWVDTELLGRVESLLQASMLH